MQKLCLNARVAKTAQIGEGLEKKCVNCKAQAKASTKAALNSREHASQQLQECIGIYKRVMQSPNDDQSDARRIDDICLLNDRLKLRTKLARKRSRQMLANKMKSVRVATWNKRNELAG